MEGIYDDRSALLLITFDTAIYN